MTSSTLKSAWPALGVGLFGLLSVMLGQDANWDLANYHLYNPYAYLHGRIGVDLAPAGIQSYFNPLLDLPYYYMTTHWSARSVAFVMGALHGLALPLLLAIVRITLPQAKPATHIFLAVAGCLGAYFMSEFGNSMGDNTTALLVLAALRLCMRGGARHMQSHSAAAGLLIGIACGLKLTNATYAIGMCTALLLMPGNSRPRLMGLAAFVGAAAAGMALSGGYWYVRMWSEFGNPFFPQFNNVFQGPFATDTGISDPGWRPKGLGEALFFPFVVTLNPVRVSEVPLVQLLWPAAYVLGVAAAGLALVRGRGKLQTDDRPKDQPALTDPARLLLIFIAASYVVWVIAFSVGRYIIAMELLFPLAVWILLHRLLRPPVAARLGYGLILAAVLVSSVAPSNWGRASFADQAYSVALPAIAKPATATVLVLAQPTAWMLPFFPSELVFISHGDFPESPAYAKRSSAILAARGGEIWAIVPAASDTAGQTIAKFNQWARDFGIADQGALCKTVQWFAARSRRYRDIQIDRANSPGLCVFGVPAQQKRDLLLEGRQIARKVAQERLGGRGLAMDVDSCVQRAAFIGAKKQPYQFCRVLRQASAPRKPGVPAANDF